MGESMRQAFEQLRQPLRPLQPPPSQRVAPGTLADYINGYDKMLATWMPESRGRCAEDASQLEAYWIGYYGLKANHITLRRASAPPRLGELPNGSLRLRQPPTTKGGKGLWVTATRHAMALQQRSCSWFQSLQSARAWLTDPQLVQQQEIAPPCFNRQFWSDLLRRVCKVLMHMLDFCLQVCASMLRYIENFLALFKNSLTAPVALLVAFFIFLNAFAIVYTSGTNFALGIICPLRLPLVHNRVCRGWDLTQRNKQTSVTSAEELNAPALNFFQHQNVNLSYGLPHLLSWWRSTVILLRARLPESTFSPTEKAIFHDKFTAYIDECDHTIDWSQDFHDHILQTFDYQITGAKRMDEILNETGLAIAKYNAGPVNQLLATSMGVLNSLYLVYLPKGIDSFKPRALQHHEQRVMQMMDVYTTMMTKRLLVDIDHSLGLQKSLNYLTGVSSAIVTLGSEITGADKELKRAHSTPWAQLVIALLGPTMGYQDLREREKWLEAMQPIFDDSSMIAGDTAKQMRRVYKACDNVNHNIYAYQNTASRTGSDWITRQVQEIGRGTDVIEEKMEGMKLSDTRFIESLFNRI